MFFTSNQSSKQVSSDDLLEKQLRQIICRGKVLTAPAQLAGYDADGLGYKRYRPDAVVIPADIAELHDLMRASINIPLPIIMRGAGTSLSGGPVAAQGGIVVHTSALRNIVNISPAGLWCEVESGVTLQQLDRALQPHGLFYPPDPSSGMVCTLGGNVAMNAGGAHCFRYGVTGNYVLGVEVILLDGSIYQFGGPAGGRGKWCDDWKRLMVGSEGTLGTFTRFWLRLLPRPTKAWTFRATYRDLASAERAIHALISHSSFPVAIELMDPRCVALVENSAMAVGLPPNCFLLITEIDGPRELVDSRVDDISRLLRQSGALDVAQSDDETQRNKLWKARKVAGGLMGQMSADLVVQDAVIPKHALAETLELIYQLADAANIPVINVFHAGDGNLHPNFIFDSRIEGQLEKIESIGKRLMQWVISIGGTLSGEHGIGNDKMDYMPLVFGAHAMRLQLAIPQIFNQHHQLNPSKVFAARSYKKTQKITDDQLTQASDSATGNDDFAASHGDERLFVPFFDPLDAVICISAGTTATELASLIRGHKLRLPLTMDSAATLHQHILATPYSPSSSRFGHWCDNVIGMNWRLPGGRIVRIGERVVKSTTGYDLMRFLLGSQSRYGDAVDYVIRLRPLESSYSVFHLLGDLPSLKTAASAIIQSDWSHWLDSIDLDIEATHSPSPLTEYHLRLIAHLPDSELAIAARWIEAITIEHGLSCDLCRDTSDVVQEMSDSAGRSSPTGVTIHRGGPSFPKTQLLTSNGLYQSSAAPHDGLPDLVFKTVPNQVISLAEKIASPFVGRKLASCAVGSIFVYFNSGMTEDEKSKLVRKLVEQHGAELTSSGGLWHSRWLTGKHTESPESDWQSTFISIAGAQ